MPETDYKINYSAPADKIGRDVDSIIRHLTRLDQAIDKSQAKLKGLGSDTSGLKAFAIQLASVQGHLKTTMTSANATEKELKDVGKGNSSLGSYATRLEKVIADLNLATAAGAAAGAALGGVGQGGPRPGGGGAPGAGAGISRRGIAAAVGMHLALTGGRKAAGIAQQSVATRREFFAGATQVASQYRQGLQEMGVLKEAISADPKLIHEQLAFTQQSYLNPEDSAAFRVEYGGAVAPGMGKGNMTKETSDRLEVEAARFGARYRIDAKTMGRMAGLLSKYAKIPDVQTGVGMLAESAEYLNVYGLGTPRSMMPTLTGLEASMVEEGGGGRFKDLGSLSAWFGAATFSTKNPATAGGLITRADKLMRRFSGKEGPALAKYGITPDMDFDTAIRTLAAVPGMKGAGGNILLAAAGFGQSEERRDVIKAIDLISSVDVARADPRIKRAREGAMGASAAFAKTETGMQIAAENAEYAATVKLGEIGTRMETGLGMARATMTTEDRLKAGGIGAFVDYVRGASGVSGEEMRVQMESIEALTRGGAAVNVDIPGRYPGITNIGRGGLRWDQPKEFAEQYFQATEEVLRAGGDPFSGAGQGAARDLRNAADKIDRMSQPAGGAPIPAPGNQGAGFNPQRR